ncbi:hypothetical protein F5Y16DRAFT_53934 [Xylariaceae sp. FL0255]|nr:hypothetical protein F5Y16DRAFT_53934 [Xylariaceae sp. FL0255]
MESFPFNHLPTELRLEIWIVALHAWVRRRLVPEQNLCIFPTLDLVASPLFAVNTESRETAMAFYSLRLDIYRRASAPGPYNPAPLAPPLLPVDGGIAGEDIVRRAANEAAPPEELWRGAVYLVPDFDVLISMYPLTQLYGPNDMRFFGTFDPALAFDMSDQSKSLTWRHASTAMSWAESARFRAHPNHWCLMRFAAKQGASVEDWVALRDWLRGFGMLEFMKACEFLRRMRVNTRAYDIVFDGYRYG